MIGRRGAGLEQLIKNASAAAGLDGRGMRMPGSPSAPMPAEPGMPAGTAPGNYRMPQGMTANQQQKPRALQVGNRSFNFDHKLKPSLQTMAGLAGIFGIR